MVNFQLHVKLKLPSFISFIVKAVGMIGRVGLVNFNVTFSLSLVLSSHPPDEPLWSGGRSNTDFAECAGHDKMCRTKYTKFYHQIVIFKFIPRY